MSRRYSTADLMAAIVDLSEATAHGFESLRSEMFGRFGEVEGRSKKSKAASKTSTADLTRWSTA